MMLPLKMIYIIAHAQHFCPRKPTCISDSRTLTEGWLSQHIHLLGQPLFPQLQIPSRKPVSTRNYSVCINFLDKLVQHGWVPQVYKTTLILSNRGTIPRAVFPGVGQGSVTQQTLLKITLVLNNQAWRVNSFPLREASLEGLLGREMGQVPLSIPL